jgi:antitoxin (DNA-binding transcriptional repressor) of toxin-antitoxin stability system
MSNISLQELAHDAAALLDRVEAGEHIVVVRGGRAVAELRPVAQPPVASRPFGLVAGKFTVPDDFDSPLPPDVLQGFEGFRETEGR